MTDIVDELREAQATGHAAGDLLERAREAIEGLRRRLEFSQATARHYAGLAIEREQRPAHSFAEEGRRWG